MRPNIAPGGLLLLLLFAACSQALEVRDDLGRAVSLPDAARRIVTLSPHATELVLAAGAERQLVGIAAGSPMPDALETVPRIGGHGAIDREALLALRPDLVIGWQSGNRASDLDWIEASGIALYRSEPASLQDIARTLHDVGVLSGNSRQADAAANRFQRAIDTPCGRLPPQTAYVLVWERPAMTVGGRHWINAVLKAAGYRNVFANLDRGVFHIATEAALGYSGLPQISLEQSFDQSRSGLLADLLSRPGPGLGEAIRMLCMRRLRHSATYPN